MSKSFNEIPLKFTVNWFQYDDLLKNGLHFTILHTSTSNNPPSNDRFYHTLCYQMSGLKE